MSNPQNNESEIPDNRKLTARFRQKLIVLVLIL